MNENNNNANANENGIWNGADFSGLHVVFHHQCFQMADLLIAYVQRLMSGSNPHAMSCKPNQQKTEINLGNSAHAENKKTPLSKPYPHKEMNKKQGWKKQSNRKNKKHEISIKPKVEQDKFDSN